MMEKIGGPQDSYLILCTVGGRSRRTSIAVGCPLYGGGTVEAIPNYRDVDESALGHREYVGIPQCRQ